MINLYVDKVKIIHKTKINRDKHSPGVMDKDRLARLFELEGAAGKT